MPYWIDEDVRHSIRAVPNREAQGQLVRKTEESASCSLARRCRLDEDASLGRRQSNLLRRSLLLALGFRAKPKRRRPHSNHARPVNSVRLAVRAVHDGATHGYYKGAKRGGHTVD